MTKMSHLHFTSAEEYRKRVIQLGEAPERVFNCGELSIDVIMHAPLVSRAALEKKLGISFKKKNLVITYHPVTLEPGSAGRQFGSLLKALDKLEDTMLIFTKPNADNEGRTIIKMIDDYAAKNSNKAAAFVSLGQERYLSLLKHVDAVIGNSSSGITEAPSFKIGTVNIGDRQKGRLRTPSIIDCEATEPGISAALRKLYSKEFQAGLKKVKSPYGDGRTSEKILKVLKEAKLAGIIKKKFYDIRLPDNI
ncbi:MAG: UDP-N-acetyl-D-glucosamine 2-epimerase, UDP-hydrolysing [Lentisphaerae bacterium GWF2_52_8]|nr:MAG: UDP-N-acetyl-D-glucosamine 2-epimerase, UDP-hydrolysing [Lentisphaerae bacterium GWF2_52_8]